MAGATVESSASRNKEGDVACMIQLGFSSLFYKPYSFSICLLLTSRDLPDGVFKSLEHSSFLAQICNTLQTPCCCCFSDTNSCPTLFDPKKCSMPGFPVFHYLPGFAQTQVIESVMPSKHLILCHPLLLLSCPQSFLASGSFPVSQLFTSGDQSTGTSASAPVLPMNI